MKSSTGERLERVNIMLARQESEWLDELAAEIHTSSGAKVSRSEIVRAAIAGLRELHRLAPASLSRLVPLLPLSSCTGAGLGQMAVLAMRLATRGAPTKSRAPHQAGSAANHDSRVLHGGDAAEKQRVIAGRKQTGMDSFDG
jgi:hypothetical protein